jgi:hypothetical protein
VQLLGEAPKNGQRKKAPPPKRSPRHQTATDDARMQGLEEDVSYLLGMGMGISVTQREQLRGRTEAEAICENALHTLLLNGSASPGHASRGPGSAKNVGPVSQHGSVLCAELY